MTKVNVQLVFQRSRYDSNTAWTETELVEVEIPEKYIEQYPENHSHFGWHLVSMIQPEMEGD